MSETPSDEQLKKHSSKWPQLLTDLVGVVYALFRRRGDCDMHAYNSALAVIREITTYFGGRMVYLPRGKLLDIAIRDAEIWRRFDGKNVEALACEFGLAVPYVYAILKEQRRFALAAAREEEREKASDENTQ